MKDAVELKRLARMLGQTLGPGKRRANPASTKLERDLRRKARGWNEDGNILGFGVGPKRVHGKAEYRIPSLIVLVATKLGEQKLPPRRRIPKALTLRHGVTVPTDVIEIGGLGELQAVHMGANAAHFSMRAGTVTAVVRPAGQPALHLLSCAHVFAPSFATGPQVESPPDPSALTHTNLVANVVLATPLRTGASSSNRVDAAIALPIPGVPLTPGLPGVGPVASVSALESGQFVNNGVRRFLGVGAVSGRIQGEIIAESVWTLMRNERGQVFRFDDVIAYRPQPLTKAGDSGMPLVRATPAGLELLGMHIGASTVRNTAVRAAFMVPISRVFDRLQIRLG